MGSPLLPILADIVMDDLKTHCLGLLSFAVPVYYRYVDDIFAIVPRAKVDEINVIFNSYHQRLKFTHEIESDSCINFLNTSVIRSKFIPGNGESSTDKPSYIALPFVEGLKVVKINCKNCSASYIGQTKRHMSTRIKEHFNNIKMHASNLSVVNKHKLEFNYDFDWSVPDILHNEKHLRKREIAEMFFIKKFDNSINSQKDTENLNNIYNKLIKVVLSIPNMVVDTMSIWHFDFSLSTF
ncbi:hypothetical protein ACFW04_013906 [Cataglyphis niger]